MTIEHTLDEPFAESSQNSRYPLLTPEGNNGITTGIFSVKLYNSKQEMVGTGKATDSKIQLDTSNLPSGTYYLHIFYNEGILQRQIIIK